VIGAAVVMRTGPRFSAQDVSLQEAVRARPEETAAELANTEALRRGVARSLRVLGDGKPEAYKRALRHLGESTRAWWEDELDRDPADEETYHSDAASLRRFLEEDAEPWLAKQSAGLRARDALREQAFAAALDADRLDLLARYETHLDRKMERTLAMLLKLKELRAQRDAA
jgi:hypothetical protein